MKTVRAVYEDGVFRPTEPPGLPEHSVVEFEPRSLDGADAARMLDPDGEVGAKLDGMSALREEDWPNTTEGIARHLAMMDRLEPMGLTPEEEADWEAARKSRGDLEKARFGEEAEALRQVWE